MKKISLFIVFVLTINSVQAQKNIVIYDEDNAKISSYNKIPTLTNDIQFGNVVINSFGTIASRVNNVYNCFFSFEGINSSTLQTNGLDARKHSDTNSVQDVINNKFTIIYSTHVGVKDATILFASMACFFTMPLNPCCIDYTSIITINKPITGEFIYNQIFSLLTTTDSNSFSEFILKYKFQSKISNAAVRNIYNEI